MIRHVKRHPYVRKELLTQKVIYPKSKTRKVKSKFGNRKTVVDAITFDSKKEASRYIQLKCLQNAGLIKDLQMQKKYYFEMNGYSIFHYKADFVYYCYERKDVIVEDVKGYKTPLYKLKKKLIEAQHGIVITET